MTKEQIKKIVRLTESIVAKKFQGRKLNEFARGQIRDKLGIFNYIDETIEDGNFNVDVR